MSTGLLLTCGVLGNIDRRQLLFPRGCFENDSLFMNLSGPAPASRPWSAAAGSPRHFRGERVKKSYDGLSRPCARPLRRLERPSYLPCDVGRPFFHRLACPCGSVRQGLPSGPTDAAPGRPPGPSATRGQNLALTHQNRIVPQISGRSQLAAFDGHTSPGLPGLTRRCWLLQLTGSRGSLHRVSAGPCSVIPAIPTGAAAHPRRCVRRSPRF